MCLLHSLWTSVKAKRIGVPLCWNPLSCTAADRGAGHAGGNWRVLPSGGETRRGCDAAEWGVEWNHRVSGEVSATACFISYRPEGSLFPDRLSGVQTLLEEEISRRDQR